MMLQLEFHGAAGTVTGSKYLLRTDRTSLLVDCGLFQGRKELRLRNWADPAFDPASVPALALTHAHIDHCGYLPRLVKLGFRGPVHCSPPTADLLEIMLFDAAKNQQDDADYANEKGFSKHAPALPLFDTKDVARTLELVRAQPREQWFEPVPGVRCNLHDAGHLLGSTSLELEVAAGGGAKPLRICFSGDVGRYDAPLYHDPQSPPACDVLVCETTYGNRDHAPGEILDNLCEVVLEAIRRGGVIVIASFAVGRAQQLIYLLQVLAAQGRIPELPIFLDSPMSADATAIYRKHRTEHDLSEMELEQKRVLDGRHVHLARTSAESRRINEVRGPAVIIASSGMMTGGRILHHLRQRLPDKRNTVLLGGYMAPGTRGRAMQDRDPTIRIHGRDIPVRAAVATVEGLSGHADRNELFRWIGSLPRPRRIFLTHGEPDSAGEFARKLKDEKGWEAIVPQHESKHDLSDLIER
jgi:metallo-beta-lactamase family protein